MKIIRLGMTETSLLFLTYVCRYCNVDIQVKKYISKIILNMVNWLYSTSGYYDKSVNGTHFDFDISALNKNYFKFINHLEQCVENCHETQFFFHGFFFNGGVVTELFNTFKDSFLSHYKIVNFKSLNDSPFYDRIDSTFDCMANRKVLAVSSFDGLIQLQYNLGNVYKIYDKFPKLQALHTIKFPYCFLNNGPHNNYHETLEAIFNEIKTIDFDIALLGCGSYGHMLCHLIDKELKKDAIYIGASIQTIFGILGSREKKNCGNLPINEYWITEIPEEYKPPNYKLIEGGCYW